MWDPKILHVYRYQENNMYTVCVRSVKCTHWSGSLTAGHTIAIHIDTANDDVRRWLKHRQMQNYHSRYETIRATFGLCIFRIKPNVHRMKRNDHRGQGSCLTDQSRSVHITFMSTLISIDLNTSRSSLRAAAYIQLQRAVWTPACTNAMIRSMLIMCRP